MRPEGPLQRGRIIFVALWAPLGIYCGPRRGESSPLGIYCGPAPLTARDLRLSALWRLFVGFGPSPLGTERKHSGTKRERRVIESGPLRGAIYIQRAYGRFALSLRLSPLWGAQQDAIYAPPSGRQKSGPEGPLWAYIASCCARKEGPRGAGNILLYMPDFIGPSLFRCLAVSLSKGSVAPLAHNCLPVPFGFFPSPKGSVAPLAHYIRLFLFPLCGTKRDALWAKQSGRNILPRRGPKGPKGPRCRRGPKGPKGPRCLWGRRALWLSPLRGAHYIRRLCRKQSGPRRGESSPLGIYCGPRRGERHNCLPAPFGPLCSCPLGLSDSNVRNILTEKRSLSDREVSSASLPFGDESKAVPQRGRETKNSEGPLALLCLKAPEGAKAPG